VSGGEGGERYRGGQPRSESRDTRDRARARARPNDSAAHPSRLAMIFANATQTKTRRRSPSLPPPPNPLPLLLSFAGASGRVSAAAVIIRKVRRGGSINVIVTRFRYGAGYIAIQGTIPVKAGMRCEKRETLGMQGVLKRCNSECSASLVRCNFLGDSRRGNLAARLAGERCERF